MRRWKTRSDVTTDLVIEGSDNVLGVGTARRYEGGLRPDQMNLVTSYGEALHEDRGAESMLWCGRTSTCNVE